LLGGKWTPLKAPSSHSTSVPSNNTPIWGWLNHNLCGLVTNIGSQECNFSRWTHP
jgi:hypothetical protein